MPKERYRHPTPKPEDFANERAKKTYFATEQMLDEVPGTGLLQWSDIHKAWWKIYESFLAAGETEEDAKQLSWESCQFFVTERFAFLRIIAPLCVDNPLFLREFEALSVCSNLVNAQLDLPEQTPRQKFPPKPPITLK